jgi:hypothetical protein
MRLKNAAGRRGNAVQNQVHAPTEEGRNESNKKVKKKGSYYAMCTFV